MQKMVSRALFIVLLVLLLLVANDLVGRVMNLTGEFRLLSH